MSEVTHIQGTTPTEPAPAPQPLSWGVKFTIGLVLTLVVGGILYAIGGVKSDLEQSVCDDRAAGLSDYQIAMEIHRVMGWDGPKALNYVQYTDC
jgi:hypothetical protein